MGRDHHLRAAFGKLGEDARKVTRLGRVLVELGFLDREKELRSAVLLVHRQLLKQGDDVGALKSVPEPRQLALECALADPDMRPGLLNDNGLSSVFLPFEAQ